MKNRDSIDILFVIPPNISFYQFINVDERSSLRSMKDINGNIIYVNDIRTEMPLGVLELSAYIKKYSNKIINAYILDFNIVLNKKEVLDFSSFMQIYQYELNKFDTAPDIIALSVLFSSQYTNMIEIGDYCKQIFPSSFVIAGGGIPSNQYKKIFNCSDAFDALCYGEGEIPLYELISANVYKDYVITSKNWVTKETVNKKLFNNLIYDLDKIPIPDYSILNINDYQLNLNTLHHSIEEKNKKDILIPFMTSRGCPHKCCFCASHSIHGRKLRYHSLEFIDSIIKFLINTFNCTWIVIQDDNFAFNKERAYSIINIIKSNHIKASFPNGIAMYTLDNDFLKELKSCGISQITVPIESGSERVLKKVMHKPLNKKIIEQVTNDCLRLGIKLNANIMIGLPGETLDDIQEAINFLKTLPVHWYYIYSATPLPGSEMFDICIDNKYIDEKMLFLSGYKKPIISTNDFSSEKIFELTYYMNLELNFLNNYCIRDKNYILAKSEFRKVIEIRNDHALAYFMLAVCEINLNNILSSVEYLKKCLFYLNSDENWKRAFIYFKDEIVDIARKNFICFDEFDFFMQNVDDIF